MTAQEVLVWIARVEGDVKKVCSDFRASVAEGNKAGLREVYNRLKQLQAAVADELGAIGSLDLNFVIDDLVSRAKAGDQLAKEKLKVLLHAMEAQ